MLGKKTLAGQTNTTQASISGFQIDKNPPTINSISWTRNDNGAAYTPNTWANSLLTGTMSCVDDHNGIGGVQYSYDGSNVNGTISTTWSESEGYRNTWYRVYDGLGNTSAWSGPYVIAVDVSPPTITDLHFIEDNTGTYWTGGTWLKGPVTGYCSASDALSQVASLQYSYDGASPAGSIGFTWREEDAECHRNEYFRVTDNAGNACAWLGPYEIMMDRKGPTFALSVDCVSDGSYGGLEYYPRSVHVGCDFKSDSGVGVRRWTAPFLDH